VIIKINVTKCQSNRHIRLKILAVQPSRSVIAYLILPVEEDLPDLPVLSELRDLPDLPVLPEPPELRDLPGLPELRDLLAL
jgi:hypothetical protein